MTGNNAPGGALTEACGAALEVLPDIPRRLLEPMERHTSFRIGAPVRVMYFPRSDKELTSLCGLLHGFGVVPLVIGNGTNLLVRGGEPIEIAAVKTSGLDTVSLNGELSIFAGAGVSLSAIASLACENGLAGFEFAHGIPGSLGGAVYMNAGAYGGEIKDVVTCVSAYNPDIGTVEYNGGELQFGYRHSRFSDTGDIILSSVIELREGDAEEIKAKMAEYSLRRRETQPLTLPSAGSTFKRPQTGYAAAIIEEAGLKGYTVGGAMVSDMHAGFVVNKGWATFDDVMSVIAHVKELVFKLCGIEMELEVKIIK